MKKEFLVGYTGFVGSNLLDMHKFDGLFRSTNIADAFGEQPDLLVYSGVRAEMFLANKDPNLDKQIIENAIENIRKINPKQIVVISTVAVYPNTVNVNEDSIIVADDLQPYGANRYFLEQWVESNIKNHLIVRLPAIYGKNLKKNFIFDYIHRIPAILTQTKLEELAQKEKELYRYYVDQGNGFFKCVYSSKSEEERLKEIFQNVKFSSLNFTDIRSVYQFYNLKNLWNDINLSLKNGINKINLVTPPVKIADLYTKLEGCEFENKLNKTPFNYDIKTKHSEIFGGENGYITTYQNEVDDIINYIHSNK